MSNTTYTVVTDSRVLSITDAEAAEKYSKQGHTVTAKAERGSYLGDSQ